MDLQASVYIADHHGLIGSSVHNKLIQLGCEKIISDPLGWVALRDFNRVDGFFSRVRPELVFLIGGVSGGIGANQKRPADLMLDNLLVNCHVIESARRHGTRKLLYLASSCIYPKLVEQPMRVEALMSGGLEPTNESYAIAKLAGLYLCRAYQQQFQAKFIAAIPANVFGPGDDFSLEDSHVIAALMRRMYEAKISRQSEVVIWGSGLPRREFIFADDMADACLYLLEHYDGSAQVNVGTGSDLTIRDVAATIASVVGFCGETCWDTTKPDGTLQKLLDVSKLAQLGWTSNIGLEEGLERTVAWYRDHVGAMRG